MKKKQSGFTLIEVLIAMAVLAIIMAMNSNILQEMIRGTRQQGGVAATQFETTLGLDILRTDLDNAGYGLIDELPAGIMYSEATGNPAQLYNDSPTNPPRAIVHDNNVSAYPTYLANSDYLVIRSPSVGLNDASGKWTYIMGRSTHPSDPPYAGPLVHDWNDINLDMKTDGQQRMIAVRPGTREVKKSRLVVDTTNNYAFIYDKTTLYTALQPPDDERHIVYGVDNSSILRPFNRADYYVAQIPNTTGSGCAPGTGTLIKAVVNQSDQNLTRRPLIDCVASMQVLFRVDTNADGVPDGAPVNTINSYTAQLIKDNVKEVRVFILAHEGALDTRFNYSGNNIITVGDVAINLQALVVAGGGAANDWTHYRWKVYTIMVMPRGFYG